MEVTRREHTVQYSRATVAYKVNQSGYKQHGDELFLIQEMCSDSAVVDFGPN